MPSAYHESLIITSRLLLEYATLHVNLHRAAQANALSGAYLPPK